MQRIKSTNMPLLHSQIGSKNQSLSQPMQTNSMTTNSKKQLPVQPLQMTTMMQPPPQPLQMETWIHQPQQSLPMSSSIQHAPHPSQMASIMQQPLQYQRQSLTDRPHENHMPFETLQWTEGQPLFSAATVPTQNSADSDSVTPASMSTTTISATVLTRLATATKGFTCRALSTATSD